MSAKSEVERLEDLWSGDFGDQYVERNKDCFAGRDVFWNGVMDMLRPKSVLEVGCNVGSNLRWIAQRVPPRDVVGTDVNERSLALLRSRHPQVNALWAPARDLPFRDARFDLVFTLTVLIHLPPEILPLAMAEVVRCSSRYVFCGEFYAEEPTEVTYRGQAGALFKRDFGAMYQRLFPELVLLKQGFLARADGGVWDDVTYWIFEKSGSRCGD